MEVKYIYKVLERVRRREREGERGKRTAQIPLDRRTLWEPTSPSRTSVRGNSMRGWFLQCSGGQDNKV